MSDYGVFEASSTDGHEEEQQQRQAQRDLGRAIEAAREGFGDFLGAATDKQDYQDRLALVMNDLMQKVADSGVMPVPGVMRKVKAALRPEFRKQASDLSDISDEELLGIFNTATDNENFDIMMTALQELQSRGLGDQAVNRGASHKQAGPGDGNNMKTEEELSHLFDEGTPEDNFGDGSVEDNFSGEPKDNFKKSERKQASVEDLRSYVEGKGVTTTDKGNGFTFPTADGAKGHIYENRAGDIVVQTLIGGSGGGVQSNYSQDETELVKEWIDRTASRKTADLDEYRELLLDYGAVGDVTNASLPELVATFDSLIELLDEDGEVDTTELREAREDLVHSSRTLGRRKHTAGSWKEVNPRSEGLHPDNAVWKIQGPNGLSGTVIDELKSGTDSDWFIFGPNGLILNRKFGEPPLTVDEAKKLVEDHINSGTLASRKQALQWDRNDGESASFSSTDSGLDYWIKNVNGQWEWSIFDFLSGESDQGTAFDFNEAESYIEDFIANSDPEDAFNQLGSRKQADDYVKGDALNFINHLQNGGYRMPKDAGYPGEGGQMDDELYDYTGGDQNRISEITRFLQENWDYYAYGASRKTAADTNLDDLQVLRFLYQFENEGLDSSASGDEQWEWAKSNIDYDTLQDAIDSAHEYGELGASQADALAYDLQQNFFGSRTAGAGDWEQTYDGADEWVYKRNPQVSIFEEEDGYYLFNNISLVEVTDTFEQAMELAESRYEGSRKEALDIDGSWEEELPGIGYASCSPKAGGGFELYMWSDTMQSEALDVVSTSEEARRIWQEWRRSDIPSPGNIYDTDYDSFLGNFKHAGGTDFATFAQGASAQEAFENARAEAIQAYGDSGYTGSIAEKDSFEMASRTPMSEEEARKFIWNGDGFGKFDDK